MDKKKLASIFKKSSLNAFSKTHDQSKEDAAYNARGRFLELYPLDKLKYLKITDYVIGTQQETFCAMVEAKTRKWANIQGASSSKFKLYYGKRKPDTELKYRFTKQFTDENQAFDYIKKTLLKLVNLAQQTPIDFMAIDAVDISQMFKAKILSLYFPERFANICSGDDLRLIANKLGLAEGLPLSKYQNLLVELKDANSITQRWTNPKFMSYIYRTYVRAAQAPQGGDIRKPRKRIHRKVNFNEISDQRSLIGEKAELFAIEWEKNRLSGLGLAHLIPKIKDLRDRPGYGYDYSSYSSHKTERYIEVKSVARLKHDEGFRFFLSENEMAVSQDIDKKKNYFFYLVFFNSDREPFFLKAIESVKVYSAVDIRPVSYQLQFELDKFI